MHMLRMQGHVADSQQLLLPSGLGCMDPLGPKATIIIQGSGDVTLTAIEELNATVQGSGNVRYRGKPLVTTRIQGSGTVVPAE